MRISRRRIGFTATAVLTLATGITAVVTMFSVYGAVVLRPVRVPDPDSLLSLYSVNHAANIEVSTVSWQRFDGIRRRSTTLTHVAVYTEDEVALSRPGVVPEQLKALRVSGDFFGALGLVPVQGRTFAPEDDLPNGPAVCLLSYEMWRSTFGGEPLVGRTIVLDGKPHEVLGVLPPHLSPPWGDRDIVLPRVFDHSAFTSQSVSDGAIFLYLIGRVRPGLTVEQVRQEMRSLAGVYAREFPNRSDAANVIEVQSMRDAVSGGQRTSFYLLLGAVGLVLFISCANTASLFLSRIVSRQREIVVKQALGASGARIVGELVLESLAMSSAAGILGIAGSAAALSVLRARLASAIPTGTVLHIDMRAAAVCLFAVLVSALLVVAAPATHVTRTRTRWLATSLGRGMSHDPMMRRLRSALVVGEVALSVCLLVAATLLTVSFMTLLRTSPGFEPHGVAAGFVTMPADRYRTPEQQVRFGADVLERLIQRPPIAEAAIVFGLPFNEINFATTYAVAGRPVPAPADRSRAGFRVVSDSYFHLMRIRVLRGRTFAPSDRAGSPGVCVVNESLARRQFGGDDPLGHKLLRGRNAELPYEIVGVIEDVKTNGLQNVAPDEVFFSFQQVPRTTPAIVIRTAGDPADVQPLLSAAVAETDPAMAVARFTVMERKLGDTVGHERLLATMSGVFALIAISLAVVGLYAVLAHSVAARTLEIGVRIAVGADAPAIIRMVVGQGMRLSATGIVLGLLCAAAASRLLRSQVFGVSADAPLVYVGVSLVFVTVSVAAALIPAWRATKVPPVVAFASLPEML